MKSTVVFPGAAILLLVALTLFSSGLASRECILDAEGHVACSQGENHGDEYGIGSDLIPSVRQEKSKEEYCMKSTDITNDIRRKYRGKGKYADQGQGDLVVGTQSMLDNCVWHSKMMAESLGMVHQDLNEATLAVGCDLFVSGENVAWFGGYSEDTDPAVQCMKQWEESEGHLDNIMRHEEGDYVAVGVYKDGEKWWCTQTFAKAGEGNCPRVDGTSDNAIPVDSISSYGTTAMTTAVPETILPSTYAPTTTAAPSEAPVTNAATTTTSAPSTAAPTANATIEKPSQTYLQSYDETYPPGCSHSEETGGDTVPIDLSPSVGTIAPSSTEPETVAPATLAPITTAVRTEAPVTDAASTYPAPSDPEPSDRRPSPQMYDEDMGSEGASPTAMCKEGLGLTNDMRRKYQGTAAYPDQGFGNLRIGTVSMLDNAVSHSRRMTGEYGFNHQDLNTAQSIIGCDVRVSGENIAMFWGYDSDPVVQCVKQWEESTPHRDAIMRAEAGDLVVVGIYNNPNGNKHWSCTQIFAKNGNGGCPSVGEEEISGDTAPVDTEPQGDKSDGRYMYGDYGNVYN